MKICAICKKGSVLGGTRKLLRGHYNPTSTKRKYPNLQWACLSSGERAGERAKVCARCMKKLHKK